MRDTSIVLLKNRNSKYPNLHFTSCLIFNIHFYSSFPTFAARNKTFGIIYARKRNY